MSVTSLLTLNAVALTAFLVGVWWLSVRWARADVVDVAWGLGMVLVAWVTWLSADGAEVRRDLLTALTTVWGLRLSATLASRLRGTPEHHRYAAMRRRIGPDRFPRHSLHTVFLLHGLLLWVASLPVQLGQVDSSPRALTLAGVLGVALWAIGMVFETVGDWQLSRFRADPENRGRVLDRGLWRYTRHPNHFGDFCVWWGLFLVAGASATGLASAPGPLLMSVLLLQASGVRFGEQGTARRHPGYEGYAARTNAFFPGPPTGDPQRRWP